MRSVMCLPLAAPLLLAGCVTSFQPGAPRGCVDVIGHRGAFAYAPENTLASFRLAMEMKADWFELDCRLSKDGHVMVVHNMELDETTNGTGNVVDKTFAELRALDVGARYNPKFKGEQMPTLDEALDLAKNKIGVYIEVKKTIEDEDLIRRMFAHVQNRRRMSAKLRHELMAMIEESGTPNLELIRKVIATVRAHTMERQVVIQSFSPVICLVALTEAPEIRTEYLCLEEKDHPQHWKNFVMFNRLIKAKGANVNQNAVTAERVKQFHRMGKTVAVWTVDEEADMRRMAKLGVDAIITNRPDVCRRVLQEIGKR